MSSHRHHHKGQHKPGLTRRAFVQKSLLLAGVGGLGFPLIDSRAAAATTPGTSSKGILVPFGYNEVSLTPGSRLDALALKNAAYLLSLDIDRLLFSYRTYAGLDTKGAKAYGGWEAPDFGFRGHFVGHYLSACSKMHQTLSISHPDVAAQFLQRANDLTAGYAECQTAISALTGPAYPGHPGYLNAQSAAVFDDLEALKGCPVPYYVIHKIMAGLVDAHNLTGNAQALTVAEGMADYFSWRFSRLDQSTVDQMINTRRYEGEKPVYFMEFGGMWDVLLNLYRITKNPAHYALAQKFNRDWFVDMLGSNEDRLGENGEHSNTEAPNVIGMANQHDVSGGDVYKAGVINFLDWMQYGHEFVTGSISGKSSYPAPLDYNAELFNTPNQLNRQINSTPGHQGQASGESCCSHNLNYATSYAISWTRDARWGDEYEKRFVNAVLAQQNPDDGMLLYDLDLKQASQKGFGTPDDSFWCCMGTGVEAYGALSNGAYYHDAKDGLWINNFIPSTAIWSAKGLSVTQATEFPDSGSGKLTFTLDKPQSIAVHLRIPAWATHGVSLRINGTDQKTARTPGTYAVFERVWKTGDTLEFAFPYSLTSERIIDRPEYVALKYGPQVLVAVAAPTATFPGTERDLLAALTPTSVPNEFTATLSTGSTTFKPLHQVKNEQYNGYTVVDEPPKDLIIDTVLIGSTASETAHNLKSKNPGTGNFMGLNWIDATDGFISYRLRVDPEKMTYVKCLYWGSDTGDAQYWRLFDLSVVDEMTGQTHVFATQSLDKEAPDAWYDVIYPLPLALTKGKTSVTIQFQAKGFQNSPGWVGGLFDRVQTHVYPEMS